MTAHSLPLIDGTAEDCTNALLVSFDRLVLAVLNANDLLRMAGVCGVRGDTADDLTVAIAVHGHLLHQYLIKVRTQGGTCEYVTSAPNSFAAYNAAAEKQGDAHYAISVQRTDPDRAALEHAHRMLGIQGALDDALSNPSLAIAIRRVARKPLFKPVPSRQPTPRTPPAAGDLKRLAANDKDE